MDGKFFWLSGQAHLKGAPESLDRHDRRKVSGGRPEAVLDSYVRSWNNVVEDTHSQEAGVKITRQS